MTMWPPRPPRTLLLLPMDSVFSHFTNTEVYFSWNFIVFIFSCGEIYFFFTIYLIFSSLLFLLLNCLEFLSSWRHFSWGLTINCVFRAFFALVFTLISPFLTIPIFLFLLLHLHRAGKHLQKGVWKIIFLNLHPSENICPKNPRFIVIFLKTLKSLFCCLENETSDASVSFYCNDLPLLLGSF